MDPPRFIPSYLVKVEDTEKYRPGGFHPISIGDTFDNGRFRILHKLGFGGSSTVWLARDEHEEGDRGKLVALKAICAKDSSEIPELIISRQLRGSLPPSQLVGFQTVDHHFFVQGPNGCHLFLILPLAGLSVRGMSEARGRTAGSRRLRADLARKVAKQTAMMIHHMHCTGIVHGDLTTSNILFRLSPHVIQWSDAEVYAHLGHPETADVMTCDGQSPGPHAPAKLVEPIENSKMADPSLIQEDIIVSDFGQSYIVASPPSSYKPATKINYWSPEARFESRVGLETDIWALGCTIFEIRAGFPLFETIFGDDLCILKQTVETLGRLPDPWWAAFKDHARWFEEDGQPKGEQDQEHTGAYRTPIRANLLEIGKKHDLPSKDEGPMIEKFGVLPHEEEVGLLEDLLGRMLKYVPDERIRIQDVILHPWFMYS